MQPLQLEYKDKRRQPGGIDIALLVIGLLIAGVSGVAAFILFPRISELQSQQALLHQNTAVAQAHKSLPAIDAHRLRSELKQANSVVAFLSLPWDALFADIEASQGDQVALLAIDPDPEKRTLMITAEAKDFNAMLSYMRRLQTRTSIKDVYLKSHNIDLKSAEVPVHFVLVASWVLQP